MNKPNPLGKFVWNIHLKKKYNIIYADPPWKYSTDVSKHYECISIKHIYSLPVQKFSANDCALFLWTPWRIMPQAIETIRQWGFRYISVAFVWVKTNKGNGGLFLGPGSWTRANTEVCLLGIRGKLTRISANVRQVVLSDRREHSRKPDEVREKIVDLLGDLPRVELFARQTVYGWDCWGNETKKFNKGGEK